MGKLIINGGKPLRGTVRISGSKNSSLPLMAAAILTDEECRLKGVPFLRDVSTLSLLLEILGVRVTRNGDGSMSLLSDPRGSCVAPYRIVSEMRASFCVMGPLLARRGRAVVSLPGGCQIGDRPIDLHIKGLRALGAQVVQENGYIHCHAERLKGANILLSGPFGPTVLGTQNVMMAASLAEGETVIDSAAREPEVVESARFVNQMGGDVRDHGTPLMKVRGVARLHGASVQVIPDRIEAATFMIAAAITRGEIRIENCRADHLGAVVDVLRHIGVEITFDGDSCTVRGNDRYKPVDVTTLPYPGFPTDVQAQLMALVCLSEGKSVITDKVYPDRFGHVGELRRMGAVIRKEGSTAVVDGVKELQGAEVMASDLRASAALVLAGLAARGTTIVNRVYHLDRGYEKIDEKLRALGADIQRDEE